MPAFKTPNLNRVIELKVKSLDPSFLGHYLRVFNATRLLYNEVACWGNDTLSCRTSTAQGPVFDQVDLLQERLDIYALTDQSFTFEQFSMLLKMLYLCLKGVDQGRGMTSMILGTPQCKDALLEEDWIEIERLAKQDSLEPKVIQVILSKKDSGLMFRVANTLISIGFRKRAPYTTPLEAGERFTVVGNVHRSLISWIEMDKSTQANYLQEEIELTEEFSAIDSIIRPSLQKFFKACIDANIVKHFDDRMHAYTRDCVLPALVAGIDITDHFYLDVRSGEKHTYSIPKYVELLQGYPELWPVIQEKLYILKAQMSHEKHRPYAAYSFIGEADYPRVQYLLGTNYTQFGAEVLGTPVEDTSIMSGEGVEPITYSSGKNVDKLTIQVYRGGKDKNKYSFEVYLKDRYFGGKYKPSPYFQNLSVWSNPNDHTILMQFDRKGEIIQATVKEPTLVYRGGAFFIRFNMGIPAKNSQDQEDLHFYLFSSAPFSMTKRSQIQDTPKNQARLQNLMGKTFRFLGVDLGLRSPFAWAVGEVTINGISNVPTIIDEGEFSPVKDPAYENLFYTLKNVKKILGITKTLSMGNKASFNGYLINTIRQAQEFFTTFSGLSPRKMEALQSFSEDKDPLSTLNELLELHKNDLQELKKDPRFIGNIMLKYAKLMRGEITERRRMHLLTETVESKIDQEFLWLNILELEKRVCRSLSYLGTSNSRESIVMNRLTSYYTNCKENFLKQLAARIVQVAKLNGCNTIVMEALKGSNKSLNSKQQNFLEAFWSVAKIKSTIINAAEWYGIKVEEVNESQTSRVSFDTGTFGHRDGAHLYYLSADGTLQETHADINAAKNILTRWTTRHTNLHQVSLSTLVTSEDNQNKRLKGFLTTKFGSVREGKDFLTALGANGDPYYLDGLEWISKKERKERVDAIKAQVLASAKV